MTMQSLQWRKYIMIMSGFGKSGPMVFLLLFTVSCAHYTESFKFGLVGDSLYQHRSPLVRYPAAITCNAGIIVGLPLGIAESVVAEATHAREDGLLFLPWLAFGHSCGMAVGVPCWALFGWWWPEVRPADIERPKNKRQDSPCTVSLKAKNLTTDEHR